MSDWGWYRSPMNVMYLIGCGIGVLLDFLSFPASILHFADWENVNYTDFQRKFWNLALLISICNGPISLTLDLSRLQVCHL